MIDEKDIQEALDWADKFISSPPLTHPAILAAAYREKCAFADRAKILLQAMVDMMEKQDNTSFVESIFDLTAIWDEAECDGYCWWEEAKELLQ